MPVENATTINQLVITNPMGTDDRAQGDDHLRLIKATLKNTFPAITGPVTVTQEQLNKVAAPGVFAFTGMIVMWSGSVTTIPAGWKLCNGVGTISNGGPVPNLKDRFIVSSTTNAGGTYNVGQTGGSPNITLNGTTSQATVTMTIPNQGFTRDGRVPNWETGTTAGRLIVGSGSVEVAEMLESLNGAASGPSVSHTHAHSVSVSGVNVNIPPYYALAFLIKD